MDNELAFIMSLVHLPTVQYKSEIGKRKKSADHDNRMNECGKHF